LSGVGSRRRGDGIPPDALPVSTLHLADGATTTAADQCARVAPEPSGAELLVVDFSGSSARWLEGWRTAVGDPPRATFVVADAASWLAGEPRDRIETVAASETAVRVEFVDSPGNLTDLGVTLTALLESGAERDARTIICLRSLTVLLQYSPRDEVFQFLHTLVDHLDRFDDATGHVHLHENAHDDETVATFRPLFDRVRRDGTQ
jgi:hypothetical protein